MLFQLNQGDSLEPKALAEVFGVSLRTVQRDLNVRFGHLPLQKSEGRYRMEPAFLGKLNARDIERFAGMAGVRGLFPSLSDQSVRDLLDARLEPALQVNGHHYENLAGSEAAFKLLEAAIVARNTVSFRYGGEASMARSGVEPYKLVNHQGIWYLAARDARKLKTFSLTRIAALFVEDETFVPDAAIEKALLSGDGLWKGGENIEFILEVSPEVARYFERRAVLINQRIVRRLENGGLIVSSTVGHLNEVMPRVRYWIPHILIISPDGMQARLEAELSAYLSWNGRPGSCRPTQAQKPAESAALKAGTPRPATS